MRRREFITLTRRCGFHVAARGARAAAIRNTARRHTNQSFRERSGSPAPSRGVSGEARATGMDRWPQSPGRLSLGKWRRRPHQSFRQRVGQAVARHHRRLSDSLSDGTHSETPIHPLYSARSPIPSAKACREPRTSGRQHNGLRGIRVLTGHQVDRGSQTDFAQPQTGHHDLQSEDGTLLFAVLARD